MTHNIITTPTAEMFFDFAQIVEKRHPTPHDKHLADLYASILAKREGVTVATVYAMANAELVA